LVGRDAEKLADIPPVEHRHNSRIFSAAAMSSFSMLPFAIVLPTGTA